jgi:hypothetical protein
MREMKAFTVGLMVDVIPVHIVVFDAEDAEEDFFDLSFSSNQRVRAATHEVEHQAMDHAI